MSASEIVVVLIGLFIGYWLVSKYFKGDSAQAPPKENQESNREADGASGVAPTEWYETLGVSRTASIDEIRKAYKSLMSQYHPDKVATLGDELKALAERKTKEINVAYRHALELHGE